MPNIQIPDIPDVGNIDDQLRSVFSPLKKAPVDGGPYVKSPNLSAQVFDQTGGTFDNNMPLLGFQYYVTLLYNGGAEEYIKSIFGSQEKYNGLFPLVKQVDLPSIDIETDVINEYNRHRINQKRVQYSPVKIVFHDVADGKTLKLWQAYYQYYFKDGIPTSTSGKIAQVNPAEVDAADSFGEFGYNLAQVEDLKYLFKSIVINQVQGNVWHQVILNNPRIESFNHDTVSYESNELVEMTFTFVYEWAEYNFTTTEDLGGDNGSSIAKEYFETNDYLEFKAFEQFANQIQSTSAPSVQDVPESGFDLQDPLGTLETVKKTGQELVSRYQQASSLLNQVQIDLLGMDVPAVELPSSRDFSSKVNIIPTSYSDVRRFAKHIRGGSG